MSGSPAQFLESLEVADDEPYRLQDQEPLALPAIECAARRLERGRRHCG